MVATVTWSSNLQSVVRNLKKAPNTESGVMSSLSDKEQQAVRTNMENVEKSGVVAQGYWI